MTSTVLTERDINAQPSDTPDNKGAASMQTTESKPQELRASVKENEGNRYVAPADAVQLFVPNPDSLFRGRRIDLRRHVPFLSNHAHTITHLNRILNSFKHSFQSGF